MKNRFYLFGITKKSSNCLNKSIFFCVFQTWTIFVCSSDPMSKKIKTMFHNGQNFSSSSGGHFFRYVCNSYVRKAVFAMFYIFFRRIRRVRVIQRALISYCLHIESFNADRSGRIENRSFDGRINCIRDVNWILFRDGRAAGWSDL